MHTKSYNYFREGVKHFFDYLCQEVYVKADDVLSKIAAMKQTDGAVTLKLYDGTVSAV